MSSPIDIFLLFIPFYTWQHSYENTWCFAHVPLHMVYELLYIDRVTENWLWLLKVLQCVKCASCSRWGKASGWHLSSEQRNSHYLLVNEVNVCIQGYSVLLSWDEKSHRPNIKQDLCNYLCMSNCGHHFRQHFTGHQHLIDRSNHHTEICMLLTVFVWALSLTSTLPPC